MCSSIRAEACRGEWMEPPGRPVQQVLRPQPWSCDWPRNRSPEHISELVVTKIAGERLPREATQTKKKVEDASLGSFPSERTTKGMTSKGRSEGQSKNPEVHGRARHQSRSTCRRKCVRTHSHTMLTHTRMNMPCTWVQICTCMPMPTQGSLTDCTDRTEDCRHHTLKNFTVKE